MEEYRSVSPGEALVGPFLELTHAKPGESLVDVGCGPGRAGAKFASLLIDTVLVDGTPDAVDPDVRELVASPDARLIFVESCVWADWPRETGTVDYAYCCDVLEHLPTEFTMLTVHRCLEAAPLAFFHVSTEPDQFGASIDETLHLTVQPFAWWRDRLAEVGELIEARDLLASGLFLLRRRN